jgi:hypothetical protein
LNFWYHSFLFILFEEKKEKNEKGFFSGLHEIDWFQILFCDFLHKCFEMVQKITEENLKTDDSSHFFSEKTLLQPKARHFVTFVNQDLGESGFSHFGKECNSGLGLRRFPTFATFFCLHFSFFARVGDFAL